MSARAGRRGANAAGHENEERWLLTYADMITLLMALFMVLFSISSVNISKYITLQESLKAAFSGSILPGGRAILQSGSESTAAHSPATAPVPAIVPLTPDVPRPNDQGTNQFYAAIKAPAGHARRRELHARAARRGDVRSTGGIRRAVQLPVAAIPPPAVRQGPRLRQRGQHLDPAPRARGHGADRQAPVQLRQRDAERGRLSTAQRDREPAQRRHGPTRSSSRVTPTTFRSTPRSSRATGSSRPPVRPRSFST